MAASLRGQAAARLLSASLSNGLWFTYASSARSTIRQSSTLNVEKPRVLQESTKSGLENAGKGPLQPTQEKTAKTQAELDAELREKMESIAGDGGACGVEYEDGRPVAMKRSVRENLFRLI
ncbi:hypothetical protein VTJ83DRAFT_7586 [Remersonia thermophila]|uniref:Uncharacterized protein n=1 Tax=Remersonia thermophila TaxID=72144 RepID=A0ABR4D3Y0_9PEZI